MTTGTPHRRRPGCPLAAVGSRWCSGRRRSWRSATSATTSRPARCRSAGWSSARVCLAVGRAGPRDAAAAPRRLGRDRADRRALVRRLQRRAQRGRAAGRRRHRRDADPGLAGADRAAGRDVPGRAVHREPRRRPGAGVRRRRADRVLDARPAATATSSASCSACCRRSSYADQPGPPEAAGRPAARGPRDLAGVHASARSRACRSPASWSTRRADAPASSIWWLVYLGVFPTAIAFTTYAFALRHMTASSLGVTTYLVPPITIVMGAGLPRRGAAHDGVRRRRARAGRRRGRAAQATHSPGCPAHRPRPRLPS